MKKIFGGALALLSAFFMFSSATPAQAQGLVNTLRGIASDPSVDNYLRNRFNGYSSMAPIPGYVGYNTANGYYGNGYNNGGFLNSLKNNVLGNNYNNAYNGYGYGYGANLNPTLYNTSYGNSLNGYTNYNNGGNNYLGWNGQGRHHKRHHHGGCGNGNGNGAVNGFYSMQNGASLGGIGYNPYTLGR